MNRWHFIRLFFNPLLWLAGGGCIFAAGATFEQLNATTDPVSTSHYVQYVGVPLLCWFISAGIRWFLRRKGDVKLIMQGKTQPKPPTPAPKLAEHPASISAPEAPPTPVSDPTPNLVRAIDAGYLAFKQSL